MTHPTKIETLATSILRNQVELTAWQRKFLLHLFVLWLCVKGPHNFINMSRHGDYVESTYRNNFAKPVNWLELNIQLVKDNLSDDRSLNFDPSFLPKSGKCTDGVGRFWSGCAGEAKRGLEFSGLAAVDLEDKTALHVLAVQTVEKNSNESLLDYYACIITINADKLMEVSKYVAADACFSRKPFVDQLVASGFELVSRLRTDAHLRYLYIGPKEKRSGAPRKYDGRVNARQLRPDVFTSCYQAEDGSWIGYTAVVNIKAWKRPARIVIIHDLDENGKVMGHRIYVATDVQLDGGELLHIYQCRFQQEFLYRDARQELGLEHCQAYSWEKIDFHLNVSLTVGSLAKVAHHLQGQTQRSQPFSIADIKTQYRNEYQAIRILSLCRIDLHHPLIRKLWPGIRNHGKRRA
ncbi:transposase [Neolewinella agarilytica]|uniref:Transposase DDE domain-containing protein n=1 Tax=Neolewinella agarilytica TaxID=478744 RepID=A0A1H9BBT4_9BACT|nr:transposase [Neolewinella agarilytica]SEP86480.1 Transposase DDE domain-containing protein [Neolewinella agarilytica]